MSGAHGAEIAVFGWGVVAPGARDMAAFRAALARGRSMLECASRSEVGPGLFAVGDPDFDFDDYRAWITARSGHARFTQLKTKMGDNALFALGAVIQALESNPGLEPALRALDGACHVYVGSGVGDLPESYAAHDALVRATAAWNRFWSAPERCDALRRFRASGAAPAGSAPPPPERERFAVDSPERADAGAAWDRYWADRSDALAEFAAAYRAIERTSVEGTDRAAPVHAIRARERAHRALQLATGCPTPPWEAVDPRVLWAIQNVPAAQISMLLGTHGPAWAPVAACSTFGVALKCARDAIERGEARAVVVGTTDPRPDPALIAAFHRARLAPATGEVNQPLTSLLGTHIAGGACVWIIADVEFMAARGLRPVGPAVDAVAVSSDAEHIITPSADGPLRAIRDALARADTTPDALAVWDLHATGTPGDLSEVAMVRPLLGAETVLTARKGLFGHGMANAGGWELTALALGLGERRAAGTGIAREALHDTLRAQLGDAIVTGPRALTASHGVKVTLGIGGVTACVVLDASHRAA